MSCIETSPYWMFASSITFLSLKFSHSLQGATLVHSEVLKAAIFIKPTLLFNHFAKDLCTLPKTLESPLQLIL
jgi:hypothetical protein